MSETSELIPEVSYSIKGGIYGKPYILTLNGPNGVIEITSHEGRQLHSKFMQFPKGEIRDEVVKEVYYTLATRMAEERCQTKKKSL